MDDLKFLKTFTVAEFKQKFDLEKIEILKNPKTGKNFFSYGVETGVVSDKFEKLGRLNVPVISEVCSAETGDTFFMLHEKGTSSVQVLAVL